MNARGVRLVAFDLDGTLVDSRRDLADSTNDVVVSYGAPPLPVDAVAAMVGDGARVLVERALRAARLDRDAAEALDRFRAAYDRRLLVHTRPYAGVPEAVAALAAGVPLALITNKPEAPARRLLEAFGLAAHFTWVIGGDSPFPAKPDPSALVHLMTVAGARPDETVMVGDSMIDVRTARGAGARLIAARYGFGALREELALQYGERHVASAGDLPRAVASFFSAR
jgi:phosphoglycolate phosphatase